MDDVLIPQPSSTEEPSAGSPVNAQGALRILHICQNTFHPLCSEPTWLPGLCLCGILCQDTSCWPPSPLCRAYPWLFFKPQPRNHLSAQPSLVPRSGVIHSYSAPYSLQINGHFTRASVSVSLLLSCRSRGPVLRTRTMPCDPLALTLCTVHSMQKVFHKYFVKCQWIVDGEWIRMEK